MRPRILNYIIGDCSQALFNANARDNCCEPYLYCRDYFAERGVQFSPSGGHEPNNATWIVFWDASSVPPSHPLARGLFWIRNRARHGDLRDLFRTNLPGIKRALVLHEPFCVCPENWNSEIHRGFDRIFTWDPALCVSQKYCRMYLPHGTLRFEGAATAFENRKLLCDISNNKIPRGTPNNAVRRFEIIRFFSQEAPSEFDLYGSGWNPSPGLWMSRLLRKGKLFYTRIAAWRGPVRSKMKTLAGYRFALCIENSTDRSGYVSNKIFDAMQSGCVPVYLGPPDRYEYFPRGTFVDVDDFENYGQLLKYLRAMDSRTHAMMLENIRGYLSSPAHAKFTKEEFARTLYHSLIG